MFLEFPSLGGMPNPQRAPLTSVASLAAAGRLMHRLRILRFIMLPVILLALGVGCHKGSSTANDPGQPPVITTGPVDTTTITGRPVSLGVAATGAPALRYQWTKDGTDILGALGSTYTIPNPKVQDAGNYTVTIVNPIGSITSAPVALTVLAAVSFNAPTGIAVDATGNLFISDAGDHTIWKVSTTNQKTLLAGSPGLPGSTDGTGIGARFNNPNGLALDLAGNLVVADTGNHTIRRVTQGGVVTTLAGSPGLSGSADGTALARFNGPFGLAVDATGGVYIADTQNHTIRFLAVNGTVSTFAGTALSPGLVNGPGASARFVEPNGLALAPNGTLYVADYGNSCIRAISPAALVTTFSGQGGLPGFLDGGATTAQFHLPVAIALDATGILWVADTHNHAIRRITPDGTVFLMAGSGFAGNADGVTTAALFDFPCGIAATPSGNLVVADTYNHILRNLTTTGTVTSLTTP
jgi:sugar lactone lactonase YvrE